ncbi:MAG: hypothetical protein ACI4SX_07880, partial [Candidatus Fimenecus sp.]
NGVIYAFQMKPSKTVKINSLYTDRCGICIENVTVLGDNEVDSFICNKDGLSIELKNEPTTDLPICLKIELE